MSLNSDLILKQENNIAFVFTFTETAAGGNFNPITSTVGVLLWHLRIALFLLFHLMGVMGSNAKVRREIVLELLFEMTVNCR